MNELEAYYNKFNEEKRLNSRHGQVEFRTTWDYIHRYLPKEQCRIADIGAGTGRYAIPLAKEGHQVVAVEPVQHNLGRIQMKIREYNSNNPDSPLSLTAYKGNAISLTQIETASYDAVLLLGPMYHLCETADKLRALSEAKRITKPGGVIYVAYLMNEFSLLTYGVKEGHLLECADLLDEQFHIAHDRDGLYSYVRLEDIASYNEAASLTRIQIITPDGPANYLRQYVNALTEEGFETFYRYHRSICERMDLMGAAAHTLDILRV